MFVCICIFYKTYHIYIYTHIKNVCVCIVHLAAFSLKTSSQASNNVSDPLKSENSNQLVKNLTGELDLFPP